MTRFIPHVSWAAVLVVAGTAFAGGTATAAETGGGRAAGPGITWHRCAQSADDETGKELDAAGAQCADIRVPLDYRQPQGPAITVAISRLRASDTAHRIGSLLINTGGPGGEGVPDVLPVREWMKDAGARFDLIGMDPRFVGRSTRIDCGWPVGTWTRSAGEDRRGFAESVAFAADLAASCARTQGHLLPHATTRNTARDMDAIRAALGEPMLSYLGYSYGSYLGSVYTQLFPHRVDRVVLDGAVDPDKYGATMLGDAALHNENGLRDWATWAAERHRVYRLGATQHEVLATVNRIQRAAARSPLRVGDFEVDEHLVPLVIAGDLADDRDESNANLAATVRVLATAATQGSAQPTPALRDGLTFLLTGSESRYGSAQAAILCDDVAVPRDPRWYWRDIQRHRASEPLFGPLLRNVSPCAFWPNEPRERPTRIGHDVPTLIVAATADPRTPYEHAEALHRKLTGSRLITLDGARVHAVFGHYANSCVDDAVNAYLRDGALPARDLVCRT